MVTTLNMLNFAPIRYARQRYNNQGNNASLEHRKRGFSCKYTLHEIVNSILYKLKTGCQQTYYPFPQTFFSLGIHLVIKPFSCIIENGASLANGKSCFLYYKTVDSQYGKIIFQSLSQNFERLLNTVINSFNGHLQCLGYFLTVFVLKTVHSKSLTVGRRQFINSLLDE